nr:hypothetical protein B0A51_05732 [Rachicladosporium sp. CCFEE 5018]
MSLPKTFTLKVQNGTTQIPSVGFGTWAAGEGSWAKDSVITALKAGYRHLDCAWMYGVDAQIGAGIRESGVPRSEIFITTKFWPHFSHPDNVELCLDKCLEGMGLEYVDLFLAHWPCAWKSTTREALEKATPGGGPEEMGAVEEDGKPVIDWEHSASHLAKLAGKEGSFVPTWKAMQACVTKGKAKAVGLSNFSIPEIEELLEHAQEIPISCNQIEVHPWLPQNEIIAFAKKHDIIITCYSPLAGQKTDGATLLKDETVARVAKKNDLDAGQLLQSWAVQRGTIPLGKSQTPSRIESNLDVRKLSDEDVKALDGLAQPGDSGRTVDFREKWGVDLFNNN